MTMGPEPRIRIFEMSVRFGIESVLSGQWPVVSSSRRLLQLQIAVVIHHEVNLAFALAVGRGATERNRKALRFQLGKTQPLTTPSTVNRKPILTANITRS